MERLSEEEIIEILNSLIREKDFIDYDENQVLIDTAIERIN